EFTVQATKAGYLSVVQSFRSYRVPNGLTFLQGYLSLAPTDPPAVFVPGPYSVTFDLPCAFIPADLRTQTFPATLIARPNAPPGTNFTVMIEDDRFHTPFNFDRFEFGVAGNVIGVREEDDLWWEA